MTIIDDIARWEAVDELKMICGGPKCKIIAPAADLAESSNALAITYAHWLAYELDLEVERGVYQDKTVTRDKAGAWFRLAHRAEFYGDIERGRNYMIVDDVMTMGGTLADLRSFIIQNGGGVVGMSVIASDNGNDRPIRLSEDTKGQLEERHGPDLDQLCAELFGFPSECFTEAEGQRIFDCPTHDKIRENILRERDKSNA